MTREENRDGKEYIAILTELMFIISHKMRIPLCNLIGILALNKNALTSEEEVAVFDLLNHLAQELDICTKEMSSLIHAKKSELMELYETQKVSGT